MDKQSSSRLFPGLAAALLAITLLAAAGAAWLHWGVGRAAPAAEPPVVAATLAPTAAASAPPSAATATADAPTAAATTTTAATATVAAPATATATPPPAEYVVVAGDTLVALATRFGVTVEELVALNGLANPDQLDIGQVLRLPGDGATAAPAAAPTATPTSVSAPTTANPTTGAAQATPAAPAAAATAVATIGLSAGGRPIEHYVFGDGLAHVVFVGAIHGGYEWNTANLAYEMIAYFERNPAAVPDEITLHVIPVANPDGLARVAPDWLSGPIPPPTGVISDTYSGRFNGHDVDLNRNWDCNWQPTAVWRDEPVDPGQNAFSEPETIALRDFFLATPVTAVVFWHSAAGVVLPGACRPATLHAPSRELAEVYATASEFPVQQALNYEISGDASDWLTTQGIPSIAVEFSNHSAMEWERNLAGTLAVLDHYAAACAAGGCGASDR